jgi:hypothetical protein
MTEQEAKTKICPIFGCHSPADGTGDHIFNKHCLASACMMWRWESKTNGFHTERLYKVTDDGPCLHCQLESGDNYAEKESGCIECDWTKKKTAASPLGFCGLAGRVTP